MSEPLTIDPTPQAEIAGEQEGVQLTAEEQDSLAVGEQIVDGQEQLLAGKYKTAEQLEKAYVELQRKLGGEGSADSESAPEAEVQDEQETSEEVSEEKEEAEALSPAAELITAASNEFNDNEGKISPETLAKFDSMSSKELDEAYMQVQESLPQADSNEEVDTIIADAQVNEIKNYAGGEQAYDNIVNWAANNLDQSAIDAFDDIVGSGSVQAIKLAVNGLKAQYENANGYEGTMLQGKAPANSKDVYRSQAELVAAMNDRRYDNDPAYRQDVIAKLERSKELQF